MTLSNAVSYIKGFAFDFVGPSKPVLQVDETVKASETKIDDTFEEVTTNAESEEYVIEEEWKEVTKKAPAKTRAQSQEDNALDNKRGVGTVSFSTKVIIPNSVDLAENGIYCCCKICWIRNGKPIERVKNVKKCLSCNTMFEPVYLYKSKKKRLTEVRPRPQNVTGNFELCWHRQNGKPCMASPCSFAHSEEELSFWKMERSKIPLYVMSLFS